jgi:small GTP-binding protein
VGVKIDQKTVSVKGTPVELILWDIYGEDEFQAVRPSYLRGASGCLLVVDGTREYTLDTAHSLLKRAQETVGHIPVIFVFNKSDLIDNWEIGPSQLEALERRGAAVLRTRAKDGSGVELTLLRDTHARILDQHLGKGMAESVLSYCTSTRNNRLSHPAPGFLPFLAPSASS